MIQNLCDIPRFVIALTTPDRRAFAILCLSFCCLTTRPLAQTVDSVLAEIAALQDDTVKMHRLIDLSLQYFNKAEFADAGRFLDELLALSQTLNDKTGLFHYYNKSGLVDLQQGEYAAALTRFDEALSLAQQIRNNRMIADTYSNIGMVHSSLGDFKTAIEHYQTALSFRDASDMRGKSAQYTNLGIIYYQQGDFENAQEYFLLSLEMDEALGDKRDLAYSYNNLGLFYKYLQNSAEALKYYLLAQSMCRETQDKQCIAGTSVNIASLYLNDGRSREALYQLLEALALFEEIGDQAEAASVGSTIGMTYVRLQDFVKAEEFLLTALTDIRAIGSKPNELNILSNLGYLYLEMNQPLQARPYLEQALSIATGMEMQDNMQSIYLSLARADSLAGDYQLALRHYQLYSATRDSIQRKNNLSVMAEMQTKYETARKDIEIQRLEDEKKISALILNMQNARMQGLEAQHALSTERAIALDREIAFKQVEIGKHLADLQYQRAESEIQDARHVLSAKNAEIHRLQLTRKVQARNYTIAGLIALLCAGFFVYNSYLIRQRLKLQTLRNKIASDLHDDVGSTLSSISIFAEMAQKQSNEVIPALTTIGESARKMLDAMADIVWTINPENDQFEKILMRMRGFAYELLGARKIDFVFKADGDVGKLRIPMEVRRNLYLIFKEATNNMVKYAEASKVSYSIKNEHSNLVMLIRDNGKGFDVSQPTEGNGLKNMRKRAKEMGAALSIDSFPGQGTTVQLKISV